MTRITKDLQPERIWYFFEEISQYPRCSKREEKLLHYIKEFAKKRKLLYRSDKAGNVVVVKSPSRGYEEMPTIVLQAHVDMVCEKNRDIQHDFERDPIRLVKDNGWIRAENTSLGADNGIGVAMMLALLDDRTIDTGKIECLFTVEEETGLTGAFNLGDGMITGTMLINLDTEEGKTIYIGCAGGMDSTIRLPIITTKPAYNHRAMNITIKGLKGGHSGGDIHLGRANAIKLIVRTLSQLSKMVKYNLAHLEGGDKRNAIPREAYAIITCDKRAVNFLKEQVLSIENELRREYEVVDQTISLTISDVALPESIWTLETGDIIINTIMAIPHGVIAMSKVMENLVETSTNCASVRVFEHYCEIGLSHRSSRESALEWIGDMHHAIASLARGEIEYDGRYPAWEPDRNSKLLKHACKAAQELFGFEPVVKVIHAGLECAVIKKRFQEMDIISLGPTIENPHSPHERVEIKSVHQTWDLLIKTIKSIYGN